MSVPGLLILVQLSYGLAAVTQLVLMSIALRSRFSPTGSYFLIAIGLEFLWAVANFLLALQVQFAPLALFASEVLRLIGWGLFLTSLICTLPATDLLPGWIQRINRRPPGLTLGLWFLLIGGAAVWLSASGIPNRYLVGASLLGAVALLVLVEQTWRNADPHRRWGLKFLIIALLLKFGLDVVVFSGGLLFSGLELTGWTTRGIAAALVVPFLAVAAARNRDWQMPIGVSRKAVFYTATLFISGLFLLVVALGGYYIRSFGGQWSSVITAIAAFVSVAGILTVAASGAMRARLRVFISKNFFSYRYDYRHEWLRLAQLMGTSQGPMPDKPAGSIDSLSVRATEAIGNLVESTGGAIWLRTDALGQFRCEGVLNRQDTLAPIAAASQLVAFCMRTDTVIDLQDGAPNHQDWSLDKLPEFIAKDPDAALLVPLKVDEDLLGFVMLDRLRINFPMNWEVYDMLKIAARQVASYLAVRQSTEALMLADEFDTFNRMSAFVAHDMKNQLSQLSLILDGADKHGHDPEYQKDVVETVREVFEQMQGLLLQLTSKTQINAVEKEQVDLVTVVRRVVHQRRRPDLEPVIVVDPALNSTRVTADEKQLERALGNIVQNAVDATHTTGKVTVEITGTTSPAGVLLLVSDTGHGMSESFIRTRLFKPFTSTKKSGMGIGAFEAREYIHQIGGSLDVASRPQQGTTFRIELPLNGQHD